MRIAAFEDCGGSAEDCAASLNYGAIGALLCDPISLQDRAPGTISNKFKNFHSNLLMLRARPISILLFKNEKTNCQITIQLFALHCNFRKIEYIFSFKSFLKAFFLKNERITNIIPKEGESKSM